jgi:phosphatidylglycerol:prolipoprotein diacylglycerol transferase
MFPYLIRTDFITVETYSVALGVALAISILVGMPGCRQRGADPDWMVNILFIMLVGMFLGSRLAIAIINPEPFIREPLRLFKFWEPGHVLYGGLFGALVPMGIYIRRSGQSIWRTFDIMAPYPMIGIGLFRVIGCYMAGCCFGRPTDMPWGVVFPHGSAAARYYPDIPLHPAQIYESFNGFAAALAMLWYRRRHYKYEGELFFLGLIVYSFLRIFTEYFRGDAGRGFIWVWRTEPFIIGISTSQFIAILTIVVAVVYFKLLKTKVPFVWEDGFKLPNKKRDSEDRSQKSE